MSSCVLLFQTGLYSEPAHSGHLKSEQLYKLDIRSQPQILIHIRMTYWVKPEKSGLLCNQDAIGGPQGARIIQVTQ